MVDNNTRDKCTCEDPWRYNSKKVNGDISSMRKDIKGLWVELDKKLSSKSFGVIMTILMGLMVAVWVAIYDTNKQTLIIVTEINKDIGEIRSQQRIINKFIPVNIYGNSKNLGE